MCDRLKIRYLLVAMFLCALSSAAAAQAAARTATVGTEAAEFVFPLEAGATYEWSSGGLAYQWAVRLPQPGCEAGFYLYTSMGASDSESGDINALLKAGQFSVFCGSKARSDVQITGEANAAGDRLTIRLKGKRTIATFFRTRPRTLTFATVLELFDKPTLARVPVTYAEPTSVKAAK